MTNEITTAVKQSVFIVGANSALGREVTRRLVAAGHPVTAAVTSSAAAKFVREDGATPAFPDLARVGEIRSAMQAMEAEIVLNLTPQIGNQIPQAGVSIDAQQREVSTLLEAAHTAAIKYLIHTGQVWDHSGASTVLSAGIPACVLRFGYLYGAQDDALGALRDGLKLGRPIPLGSEDATVSYITIADAAEAIMRALDARPQGVALDIVDDHAATPADFLRYFAEGQGLTPPGRLPRFALRALLRPDAIDQLDAAAHGDNTSAKQALDWQPRFTDYRAGIDDLLLTWRAAQTVSPVAVTVTE